MITEWKIKGPGNKDQLAIKEVTVEPCPLRFSILFKEDTLVKTFSDKMEIFCRRLTRKK